MHNPLKLTFGVEIEFIVSFEPSKYEEGLPYGDGIMWEGKAVTQYSRDSALRTLVRHDIIRRLSANGFPAYAVTDPEGDQKWTVTNDTSIITNHNPPYGYMECDVEIKSPAMRLCPKALRRVNDVVSLIIPNFDTYVNASCGLHVHIGNQRAGFPLQTLKNLCVLTAVFEHQLDSFHPAERLDSLHAKGPSKVFGGQNPWDTVHEIQKCASEGQLLFLYANDKGLDRNLAYNLNSMADGPRKTIEFRQHAGTLDAVKIMNWIQVAGGLVNAMHEISGFELGWLITDCAFLPRYTVIDLLARLKMGNLATYYEGRLYAHLRPQPIWVAERVKRKSQATRQARSGDDRWEEMENRHVFEIRWEEMENRHKLERFREFDRLEELEHSHELERRRELERRSGIAVE